MKLTSISASSIQTFEGCTARYYHENVQRTPTPGTGSDPAKLGSAVHDVLERAVQESHIDGAAGLEWSRLEAYFKQEFMKQFQRVPDAKDPLYADGIEMLERWLARTDLEGVEVLMVEQKMRVPIKTSIGDVPYTFIFDRLDKFEQDGKTIVRVVDYKTWRQVMTPEGLRQKPQGRLYAMAVAIAFKELKADEIWVCFDQLRYEPVEVHFTREDNVETWKYVKKVAEKIIAEKEPGKETLNGECMFCPIKATCKTLTRNVEAGGIMAIAGDRDAMARRYLELEGASKAIKYAMEEVMEELLKDAMDTDEIEYDTENFNVKFSSYRRKSYDPSTVREIIGDNLFASLGKINNSEINNLLKGDALTSSQKSRLRSSVRESVSEPKPKVTKRMVT